MSPPNDGLKQTWILLDPRCLGLVRWVDDDMWHLSNCDIWRDGGSYSATLVDENRSVSLWLQVSSWNHVENRKYEALFVSDGPDATAKQHLVPPGQLEREWLNVLENLPDLTFASERDRSRLAEFIAELGRRVR